MSQVAKLKKQAAEFEAKKQFDKAVGAYIKLLEAFDTYADELDIGLFNRVGDLLLRQGNVADAVDYYERGIDKYSETGFFNNAIALCNKVLRHSPGRASIYYKLGRISAKKGFTNEARTNFLEYADRMQKSGKVDEAFRALAEFADLCPDQDEIRLTLAEQLTRAGRKNEAIEQLQTLHERLDGEGRTADARGVVDRMRAIDPRVEPRKSQSGRKSASSELIFIDLDEPTFSQSIPGGVPIVPPSAPVGLVDTRLDTESTAHAAAVTPAEGLLTFSSTVEVEQAPDEEADEPQELEGEPEASAIAEPSFDEPADESSSTTAEESHVESIETIETIETIEAVEAIEIVETIATVESSSALFVDEELAALDEEAASARTDDEDSDEVGGEPTNFDDDLYSVVDFERPADARSADVVDETLTAIDEAPDEIEQAPPPVEAARVAEPEPEPEPADEPEAEPLDESMEELLGDVMKAPAAKVEPAVKTSEPSFPSPVLSPTLSVPAEPEPVDQLMSIADSNVSDLVDEFSSAAASAMEATQAPIEPAAPQDPVEAETLASRSDPIPGILLADALGGSLRPVEQSDAQPSMLDETLDGESIGFATPSQTRRSTAVAAESVGALSASVQASPDDWALHRDLGEAMLDAGDRAGGIRELEFAMTGAERDGKLDLASAIAEEIARVEPDVVKHQQKRVEYAFRTNDRARLIEAYLGLANVLMRTEQGEKSRTIYQRVLDLAPDEPRARLALASLTPARPLPAQRFTPVTPATARVPRTSEAPVARRSGSASRPPSGSYINLGDMLRGDDIPRDTRMVVPEEEPTGDEQADFADMLRKFKAGIARNVAPEDHQSHYDLAIAYKEMGLVDEAIAEFQRALAGPTNRLPTYEALGQCFLEKEQFKLASSILSRALSENASEDQLVGILYLLGRASESQGKADEALAYYQRVFVVDIQFRDIVDRMSEVEQALR